MRPRRYYSRRLRRRKNYRRNPISDEIKAQILELCKNSVPQKEIARRFNLSQSKIGYICRAAGYSRYKKDKALSIEEIAHIEELCKDTSLTNQDIANMYGVTRSFISHICSETGIKRSGSLDRRSPSEEQQRQIIDLCKDPAILQTTIAEWFGVSQSYISRLCKKHGISRSRYALSEEQRKKYGIRRKGGRGSALSEEQQRQIIDLCKDRNISYATIAEWFGVSQFTVSRLCRKHGIRRKVVLSKEHQRPKICRRKISDEKIKQIQELCQDPKLSYRAVARVVGVGETTVRKYCSNLPVAPKIWRSRKISDEKIKQIQELCKDPQLSYWAIAGIVGVSEATVRRYCKNLPVERAVKTFLSDKQIKQIQKLCQDPKLSYSDIAKIVGTSPTTVSRHSKKFKCPDRANKHPKRFRYRRRSRRNPDSKLRKLEREWRQTGGRQAFLRWYEIL